MAKKTLGNFTFIDSVRDHEYELHATGCRDLKHLPASSVRFAVDAEGADAALAWLAAEAPQAKVYTQACCNPKRMAAAGRLFTVEVPDAEPTPVVDLDAARAFALSCRFPAPVAQATSKRSAKRQAKKAAAA